MQLTIDIKDSAYSRMEQAASNCGMTVEKFAVKAIGEMVKKHEGGSWWEKLCKERPSVKSYLMNNPRFSMTSLARNTGMFLDDAMDVIMKMEDSGLCTRATNRMYEISQDLWNEEPLDEALLDYWDNELSPEVRRAVIDHLSGTGKIYKPEFKKIMRHIDKYVLFDRLITNLTIHRIIRYLSGSDYTVNQYNLNKLIKHTV